MLTNREVAVKYIEGFCARDLEGLSDILAPDLKFRGTLYSYDSSSDYMESLKNSPAEKCSYRILSVTEGRGSVSIFYEYIKPGEVITIAQLFKINDRKIIETLVVFDGRGFESQ
ncbi:MAG: hypothetical protein RIG61_06310 [Deltaproteobacteria bacterium]